MAADQRKKRFSAASIVSFREQCRSKKKKLEMPQNGLNMRSNISLQWDDKKKSVVAKREQISLTWRDLNQFVNSVPRCHNVLADVFTIPGEIFQLENLTEVLSNEVWETRLSKDERNLLAQFLPKGTDEREVIQELFAGDNFHFGNSFLTWGASLCSGNLHPDAVLHWEQCFKENKKAYYFELQNYHNDMIGKVLTWKDQWASCKDPEKEFVQKIWRSRKHAGKSISTCGNESRFRDPEENLAATSESCSWAADEKACNSDNPNLITKHGELQRRKGFMEDNYDNLSDGLNVVARSRKGEKLQKRNIQCGDGAEYMSYIKVSKEQHQRVKSSMKQSSNSLQTRSLNHVLGIDTFHVQPFELFEEEERQKLHEHWIRLAKRDLPAAFANWRSRLLRRCQLRQSLERELEEKVQFLKEDEEKENTHSVQLVKLDSGARDHECSIEMQNEEKEKSDSLLEGQTDDEAANTQPIIALEDEEKENCNGTTVQEQMDRAANLGTTVEDDNESIPISNQHLQQIPSLSGSHEFHRLDSDSDSDHNHVVVKTEDAPCIVSEYPDNLKHMDVSVSQGAPVSSATDVWPVASMGDSYFQSSSLKHEYSSVSELSLGHPKAIEDQQARLIGLESNICEGDAGKGLLHTQPNDGAFFSSYHSQDRSELLQHFFKGQGSLPYHHERKQAGMDFHPATSVSMETGQFSGHFREQLHPSLTLEPKQKRLNDLYMHQNIQGNMFSDGVRYSIPSQEHLSSVNIQDWAVSTVRLSAPLQSHFNGGELLSQNCFSGEHRARGGWVSLDGGVGQNQGIGNRNNADQSLFSVLSQCNELRSRAPYDSMGSAEQFIQSGNYGGVGGGVPMPSNVLPQTTHPINYLSGHEASVAVKDGNMGWMSLPHQNSALQDSMEKPFLRSWNQ